MIKWLITNIRNPLRERLSKDYDIKVVQRECTSFKFAVEIFYYSGDDQTNWHHPFGYKCKKLDPETTINYIIGKL